MHNERITYYFKKESVTVHYNKQLLCFHSYNMNEKGKFRRFKRELEKQPQSIAAVMHLAAENRVSVQPGYKPIDTVIIF